jgi:hypothetical protein
VCVRTVFSLFHPFSLLPYSHLPPHTLSLSRTPSLCLSLSHTVTNTGIGIPLSYYLAFSLRLGVVGLCIGTTVGTFAHMFMYLVIISRTNWEKVRQSVLFLILFFSLCFLVDFLQILFLVFSYFYYFLCFLCLTIY